MQRLIATVFILWGISTISFLLLHLAPGDPLDQIMGNVGSATNREALRHELGLDQPVVIQYLSYLRQLITGNLGTNLVTHKPVSAEIITHLPSTIVLGLNTMLFAILLGLPLGIISASSKSKYASLFFNLFSLVGLSLPGFWIAPILIILFSIKLNWLPVNGQDEWSSIVLPTVSLGIGLAAALLRMTRSSYLETMNEDYITVARAKGLSEWTVKFKHILKNAMTPIVTLLSMQFGAVLTGVVITETIFDWPGLGMLFYNSLRARNYPVAQGCILVVALIYVILNFLTDVTYKIINPRLRQ